MRIFGILKAKEKEDGSVVNISGSISGGKSMEALTITVGDDVYTYDGSSAISIEVDPAEEVEF